MRVGIDASNLRAGGGVTHLVELLRAADPRAHGCREVTVWGGAKTLAAVEARDWLHKVHVPLLDRGLPYRVWWQRFLLRRVARRAGCDVLLVPGGSDASGFKPLVSISQNLLPFQFREARRYGWSVMTVKFLLLRLIQARTFRRADGVIFLTAFAREAVTRVTGALPGRVTIIPHGVNGRFFRAPREPGAFSAERPCRVQYVSIVDVYKHQWRVAEAVGTLRSAGMPIVLDLVGPSGHGTRRLNDTLRRVDPERGFVNVRGAVPYEELHQTYASADIGVFASSCENMPNVLLESMASGLPIACSRSGPMPEILGDAGVYFDAEDSASIAAAVGQLVESPRLRAEKAAAAYRRAREYSWARCASETFAALRRVAGDAPRAAAGA